MTTQSQTNRATFRLEDVLILGIGLAAGALIALLALAYVLSNSLRGDFSLVDSLWIPLWLREWAMSETAVMGWPLAAGTSAYWYMSRAAGLVGYLLLWAATAWGLVISTKVAKGLISAPFATGLHEFLSLGALAFSGFHALILLGDQYIDFSLADIVYPFASASYRPGWVGLGQLGFYLSLALTLSFYVRKRIGHKTWRSLHYLTFLVYTMIVVHGLTAGSDASALPVQAMYLATTGTIVFLVYYRLLSIRPRNNS